jgi:NAD(P)-dependent dehydrogenase (short-subunit alcohol dehydrogenase family)
MSDLFDLRGRAAIVTGSTRGIGRAIAEALARAGAGVVISSRKLDACDQVASELLNEGLDAVPIPCHVGRPEDLARLTEETLRHYGRIDCLVCNAAVNPAYGPLAALTDEAFAKVIESNVHSTIRLCNRVLPHMAERSEGSVILVSSITGLRGTPNLGVYGLSKAATLQLARSLAVEWGPRNIRVNCIAPGLVRTDFARALWQDAELLRRIEGATPLGRIGEPADIAGAAVFLASAASRWMTGQTLVVDGGVTIAGE